MRLSDLRRFVRTLLPNAHIHRRKMPDGLLGLALPDPDGFHAIVYAQGQTERERDLTILHELAHLLLDRDAMFVAGDGRMLRRREPRERQQWREDRADQWAEQMLELLEVTERPVSRQASQPTSRRGSRTRRTRRTRQTISAGVGVAEH